MRQIRVQEIVRSGKGLGEGSCPTKRYIFSSAQELVFGRVESNSWVETARVAVRLNLHTSVNVL